MTSPTIIEELATLRKLGGFFVAGEYGLVEIDGKDAQRFLQSQTTNDVINLKAGGSQLSCLLDRKAHVQALFELFCHHDSYRLVIAKTQIANLIEHLEEYKFNDQVEILNLSETGSFFAIQGPDAPRLLLQSPIEPEPPRGCDLFDGKLWGIPVHIFRKSITGEVGFFIWVMHSQLDDFLAKAKNACQQFGMKELSSDTLEIARIEAGIPKFNCDFSQDNLLPETGLEEQAASYSKGCFLGQEVLARIKSHGAPARALVGLKLAGHADLDIAIDTKIFVNQEEIGSIKSNTFSPTLNSWLALAFVKRDFRVPDKTFVAEIAGQTMEISVQALPFYRAESTQARANRLCTEALKLYAKESDRDAIQLSLQLLQEAIELDPLLEDAYEALGVVLSKQDQLDEAIVVMKKLVELNPDSVMAHANLSVFYVEKGMKEEAEEEKAISMSIRMRLAAKEASAFQEKQKEDNKLREETLQRMEMFKQVLAIDPEDLLANYGLGSCYVDLGQFTDAVPYLVKAIEIKPTHSVAYVALAKAYDALGKKDETVDILQKGINAASKRGDMMPLKEMQEHLKNFVASHIKA